MSTARSTHSSRKGTDVIDELDPTKYYHAISGDEYFSVIKPIHRIPDVSEWGTRSWKCLRWTLKGLKKPGDIWFRNGDSCMSAIYEDEIVLEACFRTLEAAKACLVYSERAYDRWGEYRYA